MNATDVDTIETEVLVVGTGPAGAGAAALLATYGIRTIAINKRNGVANAPRSHITNQRTMEVFRDLDLESEAVAAATPQRLMGEHVWGTSLAGVELGRLRTWYTHPHFKAEHDLASPTSVCDLPQDYLEPILVNAASYRGSSVRNNTELVRFTQDATGVTSRLRDRLTGTEYDVRSAYLVGADGGNSVVAEQLGLPLEGEMGVGGSINVVFEADLTHLVEHRPGDMYWFIQPGMGHDGNGIGVLRVVRPWTRWVGVWGYDVDGGPSDLSEEQGVAIAHQLIGDDTIPVKIESVSTWAVNQVYATDNFRGRVFCVGDAVHRHSPMNGLGSNTSVQDSYNLCWKLAMVLRGRADPALLETYRDERVPVGEHIVDRATRSEGLIPPLFQALQLPPAASESDLLKALTELQSATPQAAQRRQAFDEALRGTLMCFNTHGVELNQRYRSAAVVTDEAPEPVPSQNEEVYYFPSTFPGRHLPHAWLLRDQRRVAVLDLCGKGAFTLLTGIRGEMWREAGVRVTDELDVPLRVITVGRGCDYEDTYGDFASISQIDEDGALLVRPDQMIAWRSVTTGEDPTARLVAVLRQILGR